MTYRHFIVPQEKPTKDTSVADAQKQQEHEEKEDLTHDQWTKHLIDIQKHVDSQLIQEHTDSTGAKKVTGQIDPSTRDFEIDKRMDAAGLSKPDVGNYKDGTKTFDTYKADRRAGRAARKGGGAQAPAVKGTQPGQPAPAAPPIDKDAVPPDWTPEKEAAYQAAIKKTAPPTGQELDAQGQPITRSAASEEYWRSRGQYGRHRNP